MWGQSGLFVDDAVVEFGELGVVPAVGRADEVAGDALQTVDGFAAAFGADFEILAGVFVAALHAAVAVMVDRAVADVVFVHQVDDVRDGLGIVGGVAVDLDVEDVAAAGQLVIGRLDFSLMLGRALVVDRHMI